MTLFDLRPKTPCGDLAFFRSRSAVQIKFRREEWFEGDLEMRFYDSMHCLQPDVSKRTWSFYKERPQTEEQFKNLKKVLLLNEWIEGNTLKNIEVRYESSPGAVRNMAAEFGWLCEALESIATLIPCKDNCNTTPQSISSIALQTVFNEFLDMAHSFHSGFRFQLIGPPLLRMALTSTLIITSGISEWRPS